MVFGELEDLEAYYNTNNPKEPVLKIGKLILDKKLKETHKLTHGEYILVQISPENLPKVSNHKAWGIFICKITPEQYHQFTINHPLMGKDNIYTLWNEFTNIQRNIQAEVDKAFEERSQIIRNREIELERVKDTYDTDYQNKIDGLTEEQAELKEKYKELAIAQENLKIRETEFEQAVKWYDRVGGQEAFERAAAARLKFTHFTPHERRSKRPLAVIKSLQNAIRESGFQVLDESLDQNSDQTLESWLTCFLASTLTGQLLLLSGPAGAGKSALCMRLSQLLGVAYSVIPVRPSWTEASDLLGFYSQTRSSFNATPFTEALMSAVEHDKGDGLSLISLDEINLSRLEDYAADLLSQWEKTFQAHEVGCIRLYAESIYDDLELAEEAKSKSHMLNKVIFPPVVDLPRSLVIAGTLNADQAGEPLSPKVLDRSYVIQVPASSSAKLLPIRQQKTPLNPVWSLSKSDIDSLRQSAQEVNQDMVDTWKKICGWQPFLDGLGIPVSYRSQQAFSALAHAAMLLTDSSIQKNITKRAVLNAADIYIQTKLLPWINFPAEDYEKGRHLVEWHEKILREVHFEGTKRALTILKDAYNENKHVNYLR
ncbi:hypothetical protein GCM10008955_34840 [Deinococcus malanensis]|uniref:ATPase dynein-related AAA domain-containing protein n=2 Tax=Deinococcus malanensis TaxID=1706855 RepID=A0ABQ2F443_9DEIO|nr:hypothetical protein GCM10008955_34840 [Deinococcus malanensis]